MIIDDNGKIFVAAIVILTTNLKSLTTIRKTATTITACFNN